MMKQAESRFTYLSVVALSLCVVTDSAVALDDEHWTTADIAISRGIEFLRRVQNDDGSWMPDPGPAVTGLVLAAMLDRKDISIEDPAAQRALAFILSKAHEDGGIHDGLLLAYNTSICLSALAKVKSRPDVAEIIARGETYLRSLQWTDQSGANGTRVEASHPFYGGFGYGRHGRPDGSNTHFAVQALHDLGLSCNDPVFQRAVTFFHRLQGTESNNLLGDKIVQDGGAIYATSISKNLVGVPQSMASPEMIEVARRGDPVSGLRTYGSMTYAMFKTYVYARLQRDDPRVVHAYQWLRNNYTLERNPGMPESHELHGYYYYLLTFSRALDAWGSTTMRTPDGRAHDWANDLIDKLASLQGDDGAWINHADRWLEGDPDLVTAYAVTALIHASH